MAHARLVRILLVEDSPADIELTRQALAEARIANEVTVLTDGETASDYLHRRAPYENVHRPDLILLDLNLPKKDGRELLAEIKGDDSALRAIPVVVLTTSASDEDVLYAYREHVNSYMRKPVRLLDFINIVRTIEQYWLGIVTLPPPDPST
jgi:CheY-like chemotaxis protein